MRQCTNCSESKPLEDFPISDKRGYRRRRCKDCYNSYHRGLYKKNRPEYIQRIERSQSALKERIFEHYGKECQMCGESDLIVLTIDHINDDGAKRRKNGEGKGFSFYRWIEDNEYPDDLQTLCRNCNWRKYIQNAQRLSRKGVHLK